MAQLNEQIKVKYERYENGNLKTGACRLAELSLEERAQVVSLTILPSMNADGTIAVSFDDISKYVKDFPILKTIAIPEQFGNIDIAKIQKNGCPNLQNVICTGYNIANVFKFDSSKVDKKLSGFASVSGQSVGKVITVPTNDVTGNFNINKKHFITKKELKYALKGVESQLEIINSMSSANNLSILDLEKMLQVFVGKLTDEQLKNICDAIKNINLNVQSSALKNVVENTVRQELKSIADSQNENFDNKIVDFFKQIENSIKVNSSEEEMLEIVRDNVSEILALDKNLMQNILILSEQADHQQLTNETVLQSLQEFGEKLNEYMQNNHATAEVNENMQSLLNAFAQEIYENMASGGNDFVESVASKLNNIITVNDVEKIVEEKISQLPLSSDDRVKQVLKENVTDELITAMGGIADKNKFEYVKNVQDYLDGIFASEKFVDSMNLILKDSDFARTSDIQNIQNLINKNHKEEMNEIDNVIDSVVKNIPTYELFKDAMYEVLGMPNNKLNSDGSKKSFLDAILDENRSMTEVIFDEIKKNEMSMDDVEGFFKSNVGRDIQNRFNAVNVANEQRNSEVMNTLNDIKKLLATNVNIYRNANRYVRDYNYYQKSPFEQSLLDNLAQTVVNMGVNNQTNNNFYNPKDQIIRDLNNEIAQRDRQIADLNSKLDALTRGINNFVNAQANQNINTNNVPNTPATNGQQNQQTQNVAQSPASKSNVTNNNAKAEQKTTKTPAKPSIELPKTTKEKFQKKTVEKMEMLEEPKRTNVQKFKKWVKRHPFALTALGIGAGALVGAGVGVATAGGFKAFYDLARWFVPTIKVVAGGAGVGLGIGGIAEIFASKMGLGKKDKMYSKFLKQKSKCDKLKEKIDELDKEIEKVNEDIKANQEVMKNCKLKKRKFYKKAIQFQINKLRVLRQKSRELNSEYVGKVKDFIDAKEQLNTYEEKNNKSMALGGKFQEYLDLEEKEKQELKEATDKDDEKTIKEQFKLEKELISKDLGADVSKISKKYKTGDKEAMDIINSVKESSRTATMNDLLKKIQTRNEKVKSEEVEIEYVDGNSIQNYVNNVETKGNETDKALIKDILQKVNKINADASNKIKNEKLISDKAVNIPLISIQEEKDDEKTK